MMIKFANVIGSAEATLSPSSSTSSMDDRSLDPNSDEVQVATEAKELINVCDEIKNRRLDVSKRRDSGNNANVTMQATPRSGQPPHSTSLQKSSKAMKQPSSIPSKSAPINAKNSNISLSSSSTSSTSSSLSSSSATSTSSSTTNIINRQSSTYSTSSSLDDIEQSCAHIQPNDVIIDQNQAIAIEVPPNTLKIDLLPFKAATEVHPEPGDIIEFDRTLFSQWAIYVGDGDVVVIVATNSPESEIANVQRAPMIVVARENFCRVNNKLLRAKERNLLPFHNEIVVRKALSKVGSTVPYNVMQCNSEHYVTEWKYGQRWSDQAQVSLNSFKALRLQHANSISESHNVLVNTLTEVLSSPAVAAIPNCGSLGIGGVSAQSQTSPTAINQNFSTNAALSPYGLGGGSSPIQIQKHRFDRTISISSSNGATQSNSPPTLPNYPIQSSSFNTNGYQTQLSFF
ncbi:HRAS-like suppressor 2 [Sarcoptes scabiei]|nr:HRAS-like suppressor 2 [Sarcoptes scabiei]